MTKRLAALTDLAIKTLPIPSQGQRTVFDGMLPGFGVRVSQGGTRSFVVMFGHKRQLRTLGRYPDMSLKKARQEALRYLSSSEPPPPLLGAVLTVTEAVSDYLDAVQPKLRPRTYSGYKRLLARLPSELTRRTLSDALEAMPPVERYHAHAAFRAFINWCRERGHLTTSPLPKFMGAMPKARERVLTDDELRTLLLALPDNTFGHLIRTLIYTGARRGEMAALRWEWVGESSIIWPGSITKNRTTHVFPICGLLADHLANLPRTHDLVFPSETGKVISGWSKFKRQLDEATGITGYCIHDIRRSFVSIHARRDLPGIVMEIVEPLQQKRIAQAHQMDAYRGRPMLEPEVHDCIMRFYKRGAINQGRIPDVLEAYERPPHDWGPESAWRLFNAATYALRGRVAENPQATQTIHAILDGYCEAV